MPIPGSIQLLYKTAAQFTTANITLLAGQWAIESDTDKVKIGDGTTAWIALGYINWSTITPSQLTSLQTQINNEANARALSDADLQTNINQETTNRTNSVNQEISDRSNADAALQSQIDAIIGVDYTRFVKNAVVTGVMDNSNTTFTVPHTFLSSTLEVYFRGYKLLPITHYTEISGGFTMVTAPNDDPENNFSANYIKA